MKQISYNEYQKMKKSLITESNLITNFYALTKKKKANLTKDLISECPMKV